MLVFRTSVRRNLREDAVFLQSDDLAREPTWKGRAEFPHNSFQKIDGKAGRMSPRNIIGYSLSPETLGGREVQQVMPRGDGLPKSARPSNESDDNAIRTASRSTFRMMFSGSARIATSLALL